MEYSLRAIPLGGFVSFPDDDRGSPYPADDPDLLQNRSIPERALVISAGVIANIVFAFTILFAQVKDQCVETLHGPFQKAVALHQIHSSSDYLLLAVYCCEYSTQASQNFVALLSQRSPGCALKMETIGVLW